MNKTQKYFLIFWIPGAIFMWVTVWGFITPGTVDTTFEWIEGIKHYYEFTYGWEGVIIYLILLFVFTIFIYYNLSDNDHPTRIKISKWLEPKS